jgi:hypothetical protein
MPTTVKILFALSYNLSVRNISKEFEIPTLKMVGRAIMKKAPNFGSLFYSLLFRSFDLKRFPHLVYVIEFFPREQFDFYLAL